MDTTIAKQLVDKIYEKRKAAALELEKQVRECNAPGGTRDKIPAIIDQLIEMFSNTSNPLHIRNGGLIGLAGTAIALGTDIAAYMQKFVRPLLDCFVDAENRIRYFSAECLYNIAKVSKGEILVYFNEIFDALSKLAADSELSVKNGAELLDRLLKDIVAENASVYIPLYPATEKIRAERYEARGVLVPYSDGTDDLKADGRAFSLPHFIPLLRERIYVLNPFTRSYLVSWITVLDSIPELELITYLPEFLDGLLKYLSDPTEEVRTATENVLADFLRELREVTAVNKMNEERFKSATSPETDKQGTPQEKVSEVVLNDVERPPENEEKFNFDDESAIKDDAASSDLADRDPGAWVPGQGVRIDYAAIIEILNQQLDGEHDEIQQSTALRWLAEFLTFAHEVMVPFTPRLIPAILPNLAHHVSMIQSAAKYTNKLLFNVIQNLPSPAEAALPRQLERIPEKNPPRLPRSPTPTTISRQSTQRDTTRDSASTEVAAESQTTRTPLQKSRSSVVDASLTPKVHSTTEVPPPVQASNSGSRSHSPVSVSSQGGIVNIPPTQTPPEEADPIDYQATVNELTIQFLSEFEETRVATLKWLIMLHQKAPKKILAMDDGTFPALLKTLSDTSEEVIKYDLQLLAQISSYSEETYFRAFMINLLELFSTDRRLLDQRGSLIIRQLCLNLNTEKIYRTFAEILEKEEDLEFASVMVQKLNIILITSPELAEFRKRLKNLEIRQDGQALFTTLYRSWCHNAVAVFSLCLLAQAYEHASNLLYIFAELEITVPMLVQVDKLVQLIESPVFTYLRLQLLEPEKYPYLFKCLYGLLMLLPQSTAFVSLSRRLNAVNSAGFLHIAPKSTMSTISTRSKIGREDIKWPELLHHFRSVQARHEKARRLQFGVDTAPFLDFPEGDRVGEQMGLGVSTSSERGRGAGTSRPYLRRKVTNEISAAAGNGLRPGPLSPLNPRARVQNGPTPTPLNASAILARARGRGAMPLPRRN
ncbi:hypothetical protein AMATHDRAFT_75047 [Amanita thiersii Skay4041]|uniref:Vacuolar protein 14 C-terminal Fig4-binding domain-containing protein n=1 Tax=Amanita thiersii Skay4041 TaxID=703135 RepID=A0A2A9NUK3_9AGAR|nr:hypothetical protein AMATHDRAFT_75047 [Amanita thiersii Skay4041]